MIEKIFSSLPSLFVEGAVTEPLVFYFSMDEYKKTVYLSAETCAVDDGRTTDEADCVCKTSPEFFLKIWQDDYRPGVADFLSGAIKSNNPEALRKFLIVFGKVA
jgi:putative sterol carrier protein